MPNPSEIIRDLEDSASRVSIRFEVPGEPQALQRHRHGRNGRGYDPAANVVNKGTIQVHARQGYKGPLFKGPIHLTVIAHLRRPKSHYRTGQFSGELKATAGALKATKKPDVDNLAKLIMDALTGVLWEDDRLVVRLDARKVWATGAPKTEIFIHSERPL